MTPEEFWRKVDKSGGPDACWPWIGCKDKAGYGVTSVNWKQLKASAAAMLMHQGFLTPGKIVCHHCDNPPCCNPNHLYEGTHQDNANDMKKRGRQSCGEKHSKAILPGRHRGERHYAAKTTEAAVREIRRIYADPNRVATLSQIATQFNISLRSVQHIVQRDSWKHLR